MHLDQFLIIEKLIIEGIRVMMTPFTFLRLASYASRGDLGNIEYVKKHIASNGSIGSPFLMIHIPKSWRDGDFSIPANVVGHEGRTRMLAVEELENEDFPVEVHLIFTGGVRNRDLTPEIIQNLNKGMFNQDTPYDFNTDEIKRPKLQTTIKGPLFTIPK